MEVIRSDTTLVTNSNIDSTNCNTIRKLVAVVHHKSVVGG